ncbi:MAG: RyR domain-containing protein [Acidobacteria bacterium]|nr:RyR domain-containing protein [Acidobacteriota bacterium]
MNQGATVAYFPHPIDTSAVILPPQLIELTERLAEHAHDTWALRRMGEGWVHGPKRDDGARQHPCLVPYAELPDSEKEYDRQAALATVRAVLALGYRITP